MFIDNQLSIWFYNLGQNIYLSTISQILSGVWAYIYVYIIGFLLIWYFVYAKIWKKIFMIWFLLVVFSLLVNFIKNISSRERPYIYFGWQDKFCPANFSFPSGHSELAMLLALILWYLYPKYKYIFIFIAILIWLSRIMLWCHYFSDVVIWYIIGIVWFMVIRRYLRK